MSVDERTVVLADTGSAPQRSGPGPRLLAFAAALVVLVLAGLVVLVTGGDDGRDPRANSPDTAADVAPGTATAASFPRTEAGATDAAVAYLAAFADPGMYDSSGRNGTLAGMLDPSVAADLSAQFDVVFDRAAGTLGLDAKGTPASGTLVSRTSPLGVDVVSFDPDRAIVAVWSVGVLGVAGDASAYPVQTTFSTDTVTLVWSGGTWRWIELSHVEGPVPAGSAQVPSPASVLSAAQERFQPYGAAHGR